MMTENDANASLVRVRAQVMTRDDSSGGWVPLEGGGLSNVSVCKMTSDKNEYLIYGKRISDQSIVLDCTIKKDFQYNKVMPTFHHWKTGDKKFGLTFQTAADARAFDKGVFTAIDDLLEGSYESSIAQKYYPDVGEDEVFMTLDLPVELDSNSSDSLPSHNGVKSSNPQSYLHRMYFESSLNQNLNSTEFGVNNSCLCGPSHAFRDIQQSYPTPNYKSSKPSKYTDKDLAFYSTRSISASMKDPTGNFSSDITSEDQHYYVQCIKDRPHDYSYPVVPPAKKSSPTEASNTISLSSLSPAFSSKKSIQLDPLSLQPPPKLPTRSKGGSKGKRTCGKKRRCKNCHEVYSEDSNPRGSCPMGPDAVRDGIEILTCLGCARGMMYHCFAGAEGDDEPPHPCAPKDHKCLARWIALGILSIFLPCLCLYLPLAGCHRAAKTCAVCGARHCPS